MARKKKTSFFVINIKLLSSARSGADAYIELFRDLMSSRAVIDVSDEKSVALTSQTREEIGPRKISLIFGKIAKFTTLKDEGWLDFENMEEINYRLPDNLFPNLRETDYFFIPEAHRLVVRKAPKCVTINDVVKYLDLGLLRALKDNESVEVNVEQRYDGFDKILKAEYVQELSITVSYTNNDINKDAEEFMDDELKNMQVQKFKVDATNDHRSHIAIEDSKVLKGTFELARSNGEAKAKIINGGVEETVNTKDHPFEFKHTMDIDDIEDMNSTIFSDIMNEYRSEIDLE